MGSTAAAVDGGEWMLALITSHGRGGRGGGVSNDFFFQGPSILNNMTT